MARYHEVLKLRQFKDRYGIEIEKLGYVTNNGRKTKTNSADFRIESKGIIGHLYHNHYGVPTWGVYLQQGDDVLFHWDGYEASTYIKMRKDLQAQVGKIQDEHLRAVCYMLYAATYTDINHVFKK